ncbi:XdhC family protein [Aequorivita echinoideorum]|uniref:XdhC family protein n=1 Tax=Aequorivita echinoideorum TaxID=1549647 RepID=A0ABS5S4H2_9FLAO|nr:XdhC/CoxI family protein [Aequorivita echinoideorum]MBT0608111.1 XdhC family protein [Aequorivita echinoideorum]
MTHEFKKILDIAVINQNRGLKNVLATVVYLDGSSYRKPGVRMLIAEDGTMTGAVSGGCVEKEVLLQSKTVFKNEIPKVITYDGRYRLGCEGILYILLEPFKVEMLLYKRIKKLIENRKEFQLISSFAKQETSNSEFGTELYFEENKIGQFHQNKIEDHNHKKWSSFIETLPALSQIFIFGAEHDAVKLCAAAALLGWDVKIVASPKDPKTVENFTGATQIFHFNPQEDYGFTIDASTAIVLMNHNYARDLHFLLTLKNSNPFYIGILGSADRKEKLMGELMEVPDLDIDFLDRIYSPAGIDIGAVTPEEISVSILSEILAIKRRKEIPSLRDKTGKVHS